jgi:hypothetical protein
LIALISNAHRVPLAFSRSGEKRFSGERTFGSVVIAQKDQKSSG